MKHHSDNHTFYQKKKLHKILQDIYMMFIDVFKETISYPRTRLRNHFHKLTVCYVVLEDNLKFSTCQVAKYFLGVFFQKGSGNFNHLLILASEYK